MPDKHTPPPHPAPRKPSITLPKGSCDAHCHVFGPGRVFRYAPDAPFRPDADVPKEALRARHEHLGLDRAVIVHSVCHGSDHAALLDALDSGAGRYRGVAVIGESTGTGTVARLHRAGVRGFRLNFLPHLGPPPSPEKIRKLLALVGDHGWHAQIHVSGSGVLDHRSLISALPVPVVIDHLGRVAPGDEASIGALRGLLDTGRVWVKVSGVDRVSREGPPYADAVALAASLVAYAPDRVLWGTDFPHPNIVGASPDDGLLVDLLGDIAPGPEALERLLVTNPSALFWAD